jgi:integrase
MLIDQGESAKYIQDQVGHASITMTVDTYGHLMPQAKKEAAAKLEKSLFGEAKVENETSQEKVN